MLIDNYAYLYGLSDFWVTMFQDPELNQKLLETTTISASEVYSRFLQITSTISINDIVTTVGSDISLVTIDVDEVDISDRVFSLSKTFTQARLLSDRPFLPLKTLEQNVDYEIVDGVITFSQPLLSYGFPYTITETGKWRFALWASDAQIDEQLISKAYAGLVKVSPQTSTERYRDFVKGLFFLYTNGPNIAFMNRGLSLSLGIPLARTNETVLMTTVDSQTGQWVVVTDFNSYSLPYSIEPTVSVGQVLSTGDAISNVIEMQDYTTDGEWWVNLYIPKKIIPGGATAVPGSQVDLIMRNYLKTHTFLVKINWNPGYEINGFENLLNMINTVKPSYTVGVFAWAVPIGEEEVDVDDEQEGDFEAIPTVYDAEDTGPRGYIYRESGSPDRRSEAWFIRSNRDPDSIIFREEVDTENPFVEILEDDYLYGVGTTEEVDISDLTPLYNLFEDELQSKLAHLGVVATLPLPDKIGLQGNLATDAEIMTRDSLTLPTAPSLYYSDVSSVYVDNMFLAEMDGYEPEIYRSYLPTVSNPVKIIAMRMADESPIFSVFLLQTNTVVDIDIPTMDELQILMV